MKKYLIVLFLVFGSIQLYSMQSKTISDFDRGIVQNLEGIDSSGIRGNSKEFSKDQFIDRNFTRKKNMQKFLNESGFQGYISIVKDSTKSLKERRNAKIEIKKLLQEQIRESVNTNYKSVKNGNNVIVSVINSYFDKFVVNNKDNIFVQNRDNSQDLSMFISYNEEQETGTNGTGIKIYIEEMKESNTFDLPLNILGNTSVNECEVKFDSSYGQDNKVEKTFSFKNNQVHWYRANVDPILEPEPTELNSMGKVYREKIAIPGLAYVYVPESNQNVRKYDKREDGSNCPSDYIKMSFDSKYCVSNVMALQQTNYQEVNQCNDNQYKSEDECFHYFNYIKYILSYEINLETGESSIIVKENKNPFSRKTRKYLMETELFNGNYTNQESNQAINQDAFSPSSKGANKDHYRNSLNKDFDITTMENDMETIVYLQGNVIELFKSSIPVCSSEVPIVVKLKVKQIIEDFMKEKYRMTLNSVAFKSNRCEDSNYEEYNGKCYKSEDESKDLDNPCEDGYQEYENRCVKKTCVDEFYNDNSGYCRKNKDNTKFKEDSLKNYISVGR